MVRIQTRPPPTHHILSSRTGTSGIGRATVLALVAHNPSHIYFTGRNAAAAATVIASAKDISPTTETVFIPLDLSSTRDAIRSALLPHFTPTSRLEILIANAGIMAVPPGLTAEGFEIQFGTNVIGHAILLHLLRPLMLRTAALSEGGEDVRFISLSSSGHTLHPPGGIQFSALRDPDACNGSPWQRYGQSKLGNILLAAGMAAHHPGITSLAVHPGLVDTNLSTATAPGALKSLFALVKWLRKPVYRTPEQGAANTLWAVAVPRGEVQNGAYFVPVGRRAKGGQQAALLGDEGLRERFWRWVEGELEGLEGL